MVVYSGQHASSENAAEGGDANAAAHDAPEGPKGANGAIRNAYASRSSRSSLCSVEPAKRDTWTWRAACAAHAAGMDRTARRSSWWAVGQWSLPSSGAGCA